MEFLIALLLFVILAIVLYQLMPIHSSYWVKSLGDTLSGQRVTKPLPFWRGLLTALGPVVRFTPLGWTRVLEGQLYWTQLAGKLTGWALPEIVALHLTLAAAGFVVGMMADLKAALLFMFLFPFVFNRVWLAVPARTAQRRFGAELPEFVSLLAAEVAADIALSEALVRLSNGSGLCAAWFRQVINTCGMGELFTEGSREGAIRKEALLSGDSDLIGLATSLDNVKRRGTGARELLAQIAESTASNYATAASQRAERVGTEVLFIVMLFFFIPAIIVLLVVTGLAIFNGGMI